MTDPFTAFGRFLLALFRRPAAPAVTPIDEQMAAIRRDIERRLKDHG